MFTFRTSITLAVMAFIVALAALLIAIQVRALHWATQDAASAYMDATSTKAFGRLQTEISAIASLVHVLATSSSVADSNERTETGPAIPLFKAALQELPQMDSVYVGFENGAWLQVRRISELNDEQRGKDTLANLREVPEFVVNIVSMHMVEKMNFTAADFPPEGDEFLWAELTVQPSAKVRPPRVAESRAHLECELTQIIDDHNTHIVLGRIVHAHADPSIWKDGRVDPRLLDPVGRLAGSGYAALGDLFNLERPTWKEIAAAKLPSR